MTIRNMGHWPATTLLLLALGIAGCTPSAAQDAETSRREAAAAQEAVEALTQRVDALEARIGEAEKGLTRDLDDMLDRFDRRFERLRKALATLRTNAGSEAAAALGRAEEALRQLTVLEDRFEYHLRRTSGG